MNVTFRLPTEELEKRFVKESTAAGFDGLKGHRSVGGTARVDLQRVSRRGRRRARRVHARVRANARLGLPVVAAAAPSPAARRRRRLARPASPALARHSGRSPAAGVASVRCVPRDCFQRSTISGASPKISSQVSASANAGAVRQRRAPRAPAGRDRSAAAAGLELPQALEVLLGHLQHAEAHAARGGVRAAGRRRGAAVESRRAARAAMPISTVLVSSGGAVGNCWR